MAYGIYCITTRENLLTIYNKLKRNCDEVILPDLNTQSLLILQKQYCENSDAS